MENSCLMTAQLLRVCYAGEVAPVTYTKQGYQFNYNPAECIVRKPAGQAGPYQRERTGNAKQNRTSKGPLASFVIGVSELDDIFATTVHLKVDITKKTVGLAQELEGVFMVQLQCRVWPLGLFQLCGPMT